MIANFFMLATLKDLVSFAAQALLLSLTTCIAFRVVMAKTSSFPGPRLAKMSALWMLRYDLRGK
jgi:hypothetical protein